MANQDYENRDPARENEPVPEVPDPESAAPAPEGRAEEDVSSYEEDEASAYEEFEEYEPRFRGRRVRERMRREREAEQPEFEPEDELDFSMRDVPLRTRRRRGRYRDAGRGCLVAVMYTAFILGVSMFLASLVIIMANEVFAFVKPDRTAVIEVKEDTTADEVAQMLEEGGIIQYPTLFKLYCAFSNAEFREGKYEINASLDYPAIARTLRYVSSYKETVWVTIPEGYTAKQIVESLAEKKVAKAEDLYDAIQNFEFSHGFLEGIGDSRVRLEGYLFPDTYEFYVDDSAPNVIAKFLTNFDAKFTQKLRDRADELGLSLNDVVIIASMVEREARRDDERAIVASVIFTRLAAPESYPRLQIDATVQYIVGHAPTPQDLQIEDPYNTYLNPGLPPGPISNPGIASLEAVLYPAETDYYYYVARADGSHIFSRTLEEHNAAIEAVSGD